MKKNLNNISNKLWIEFNNKNVDPYKMDVGGHVFNMSDSYELMVQFQPFVQMQIRLSQLHFIELTGKNLKDI